jgi:tetratricopeptide (TPR) repeat protein
LEPDNNGKNIRAWTGEAFAYHQLGLYEDEMRCCSRALDAGRSDPWLWLFYAYALEAAGRKREALSIMDDAYEAYLMAGEPAELRGVFADVKSAPARP